jgi:hypothetical protein
LKFTTVADIKARLEGLESLPHVAEKASKWLLYNSHRRLEQAFIQAALKDVAFTSEMGNVFTTTTPLVLQRTLDRFLFRLDQGTAFWGSPVEKTWVSERARGESGQPCVLPRFQSYFQVGGREGLDLHYTEHALDSESRAPLALVMPGAGMRMEGTLEDSRGREFVSQLHGLGIQDFILVNLPGFSRNEGEANQYSLQRAAEALEAFLETEQLKPRTVIFGYSTSNYVANAILAYHHQRELNHRENRTALRLCFEFSAFTSLPKTVLHHVFQAPNPDYTLLEQWMMGRFLPLLERSGGFHNLPLLARINPKTELHFLVSETDQVTPVSMVEHLLQSAREEGIHPVTLTILPACPDTIDAHAEAMFEGVLNSQTVILKALERHFEHFKPQRLQAIHQGEYRHAKAYGNPMAKEAVPWSLSTLVDAPPRD